MADPERTSIDIRGFDLEKKNSPSFSETFADLSDEQKKEWIDKWRHRGWPLSLNAAVEGMEYKGSFDTSNVRRFLGLDGGKLREGFPPSEVERWANMLYRHNSITDEEIESLGLVKRPVVTSSNGGDSV